MPIYTNVRPVKNMVYRNHVIVISQGVRGAVHCGNDHNPLQETRCSACGKELSHLVVFPVMVDGKYLSFPIGTDGTPKDPVTQQEAERIAKRYVDEIEKTGGGAKPERSGTPRRKPATKGIDIPEDRRHAVPTNIDHQMTQLGWPQRARRVVSGD